MSADWIGVQRRRLSRAARVGQLVDHVRTPLYGNAYALILSTGLSAFFGFAYWAVAARLYSTEQVGVGSALISTLMFLSGLAQLNLRVVLNRFIPVAGARTRRLIVSSYAATIAVSVVVGMAFVVWVRVWGSPSLADLLDPVLAAWFVASTALWSIFNVEDGVLTGLRQAIWVPLENGVYGAVKILLLVAMGALGLGSGLFLSWTIPVVGVVVLVNLLIFRRLVPRHLVTPRREHPPLETRRFVRFAAGDYLAALIFLAYSALLPILVLGQAGATAAANFYIVWIIYVSLQYIPLQLTTSLTVEALMGHESIAVQGRRMLIHMARFVLPAVALLVVLAPFVLRVFGANYEAQGTTLMRLLALSLIPFSINTLYLGIARLHARIRHIIAVQAALAVGVLGVTELLLPTMGITGIGVAWLASQSVVALVLLATALRPIIVRP